MIVGINGTYSEPSNGMTKPDLLACQRAAEGLGEVIVFRSTGKWSLRWLERGYPSKNFHTKGKSSDWGPQAGLVPYDGELSKAGGLPAKTAGDPTPAQKGTAENDKGIKSQFVAAAPLRLTDADIAMQAGDRSAGRTAIANVETLGGPDRLLLHATRTADGKAFRFLAIRRGAAFDISVVPEGFNRFKLMKGGGGEASLKPLLVMATQEAGAGTMPMTGDYDLMAICPPWDTYMTQSTALIGKAKIHLNPGIVAPVPISGQKFAAGTRMDAVLDPRLQTGARANPSKPDGEAWREHADMGNLTPRILRCINRLNVEMGAHGARTAFRRVHHNAESHRHANFGALSGGEMAGGEGFPLTAFHPRPLGQYGSVCTLLNMGEFKAYAAMLAQQGFLLPRNWSWGMSIRDRVRSGDLAHLNRR